jgi:hypothetical protein
LVFTVHSNIVRHDHIIPLYTIVFMFLVLVHCPFHTEPLDQETMPPMKGTVSRDFLCPVFFIKHLLLVPKGMPRTDFEFFRKFVELFVFIINSPAMNTLGSKLESFRFSSFCKHKSHVSRELK